MIWIAIFIVAGVGLYIACMMGDVGESIADSDVANKLRKKEQLEKCIKSLEKIEKDIQQNNLKLKRYIDRNSIQLEVKYKCPTNPD